MYLNDWKDSGQAGMLQDFGIEESALTGAEVIFASYTYENYSGSAFVLFRKAGELFEVNAGHCSCYGLSEQGYGPSDAETQWSPESTTVEALLQRIEHYDFDGCRDQFRELLKTLV